MKAKILVMLLTLIVIVNGCGVTQSDGTESTETLISTEESVVKEMEGLVETEIRDAGEKIENKEKTEVTDTTEEVEIIIELEGNTGYVSDSYVVEENVDVSITPSSGNESNSESITTSEYTMPSVSNSSEMEDTEWIDDWGEPDFVGGGLGTGEPITDGYETGVEIEISPVP